MSDLTRGGFLGRVLGGLAALTATWVRPGTAEPLDESMELTGLPVAPEPKVTEWTRGTLQYRTLRVAVPTHGKVWAPLKMTYTCSGEPLSLERVVLEANGEAVGDWDYSADLDDGDSFTIDWPGLVGTKGFGQPREVGITLVPLEMFEADAAHARARQRNAR